MIAGALPSGEDSSCNAELPGQPDIREWADRTPSSQERPECLVIDISEGMQASERPAGRHVAKRNAEHKQHHKEGLSHVLHAPRKVKGKAERRDLRILPPSNQPISVNQQQGPALSSFGIAQQNAAKFTDGEVWHLSHESKPVLRQICLILHLACVNATNSDAIKSQIDLL